ncbi:MAG: 50S ribosomal protein L19 [Myxococcales bacterium]|nr:50S ribosomal protein L19 [Myxococcales bacterium]MCB9545112.1 50S ribosomal protein L19 [Myxococcales bacterium]
MNALDLINRRQLRSDLPAFRAGDTLRVHVRIKEGDKERIQAFEGVCLRRHNSGVKSTFTVRKVSYNVGVERIFPVHSPMIDRVEVVREGRVRQARIYFLRERRGKAARIRARSQFM